MTTGANEISLPWVEPSVGRFLSAKSAGQSAILGNERHTWFLEFFLFFFFAGRTFSMRSKVKQNETWERMLTSRKYVCCKIIKNICDL